MYSLVRAYRAGYTFGFLVLFSNFVLLLLSVILLCFSTFLFVFPTYICLYPYHRKLAKGRIKVDHGKYLFTYTPRCFSSADIWPPACSCQNLLISLYSPEAKHSLGELWNTLQIKKRCWRVRLLLRQKLTDLDKIWKTVSTLLRPGPGRL